VICCGEPRATTGRLAHVSTTKVFVTADGGAEPPAIRAVRLAMIERIELAGAERMAS